MRPRHGTRTARDVGENPAMARENLALSAAVTDSADAVREAAEPLAVLLTRAQHAGAVRADITVTDLHAILAAALLAELRLGPASRGRALRVVTDGLAGPGRRAR
jgi:transcriptional regulator SbtR-like protein